MRVVLTTDFYAPFIGGAERQVQLLAEGLATRGHEVSVATVHHAGMRRRERTGRVDVRRMRGFVTSLPGVATDPGRRFHPPFPDPWMTFGLRELIAEKRPDVVHASGWIAYSSAAALLGTDIPLVISIRDYGYSCAVRTLLEDGRQVSTGPALRKCAACSIHNYGAPRGIAAVAGVFAGRRLLRRKVRAAHSVSSYVEQIARRDLVGAWGDSWRPEFARIADIVPDRAAIEPPRPEDAALLDRLPREPFILFVGQLQPHKGIHVLLAAYQQLSAPPPLVLIGTVWPETPRTFPDGVTMLSDVPHRVVMEAWSRCLFGVVPSVWPDPLPGVTREAMASGKAVVATAIGGNLDMVGDGETGLLVPPGDPSALARAMHRLIGDAALRDRLGDAAAADVRQYDADHVVSRFETLYERALGRA